MVRCPKDDVTDLTSGTGKNTETATGTGTAAIPGHLSNRVVASGHMRLDAAQTERLLKKQKQKRTPNGGSKGPRQTKAATAKTKDTKVCSTIDRYFFYMVVATVSDANTEVTGVYGGSKALSRKVRARKSGGVLC